jgi:hypothetical protein
MVAGVAALAPSASASDCHWKVVWSTAGVYDYPATGTVLKDKHAGDIVGPYCNSTYNSAEGHWFTMVACSCAPDTYGWMRSQALVAV